MQSQYELTAQITALEKELAEKNRELVIEAALERVRAVATGMKEPADMLEICRTISHQLELLNVKEIRNVQTAIFYERKSTYMNYEYYAKHDKTIITETTYTNNEIHRAFANQMLKGAGEFFITHIKGNEVKDWIAYQKTTNVFIDEYLNTASSLNYYWYSLGSVALGISTYEPLKEEDIHLFKRFLKVFQLSYTRYLDIEQAEAQARESQIQLALERVRARTMAMQKSDELSEAVYILFQQFRELGENPDQATIGVINENEKVIEYWVTMYGNQINKVFKFSIDEPNVTNKIYRAWKENKKSLVIDLSGNALSEFMVYRAGKGGAVVNPNEKRRIINVAFFSKGLLNVQSNEARSEESVKLLERFASVFEQTYTRFLDLQKAEVQARESQIQLALERVRARTMAMQKSDVLKEVIQLVYEQFVQLKINVEHTGFIIDYKARDDMHIWLADQHEVPFEVTIPYFDCAHWNSFLEAKEKGKDFFTNCLSFDEKNKFYRDLFKLIPAASDEAKKYYLSCPGLAISTVLLDNVGLYIENFSGIPYSDEENKTLMRFGKVFQQTYTRFLDLQNAEAQAREAQIEAALERVRSRTMAMHNSSELIQTAELLVDQLKQLGAEVAGAAFSICDKNSVMVEKWTSLCVFSVPYTIELGEQRMYEAWKNHAEIYEEVYEGERLKKYYELFMKIPAFKQGLQKFIDAGHPIPTWQKNHAVTFKHGYLLLITTKPFNETQIFLRFGKVFEQTYTRFLDLQKAEAQAREAQIEAALEKVRSRSLAMHHSNELEQVVASLFDRLVELGLSFDGAGIFLFEKQKRNIQLWVASIHQSAPINVDLPYNEEIKNNEIFKVLWNAMEKGEHIHNRSYSGETKNNYFRYVWKYNEAKIPESVRKIHIESDSWTVSYAVEKNSIIGFDSWSGHLTSEEDFQILIRFARVFEQAYIRFLDLQKAEAQAREAQIEASLERVRSKTMAMHNSNDVGETVTTMFGEFVHLGIHTNRCGILIFDDRKEAEVWTAKSNAEEKPTLIIGHLDLNISDMLSSVYEAWKAKKSFYQYELIDEKLIRHYEATNRWEYYPVKFDMNALPKKELHSDFFFPEGAVFSFTAEPLSEEHSKILKRFAGVFGQTYRRYLDLKKAEAQAREAQIEASLERVRARTMAMHSSDDVSAATAIMFTELEKLGIENYRGGILNIRNDQTMEVWSVNTGADGNIIRAIGFWDMTLHPWWQLLYKGWINKDHFLHYFLTGNEKDDYVNLLNARRDYLPTGIQELPDCHIQAYYFSEGSLWTFSLQPHTEENKQIMKRFASVFSLTFRRYQDLKKAEAQAREAQIETALERVRASTMAMHKSEDLAKTAAVLFAQLSALGNTPDRISIGIIDKPAGIADMWLTDQSGNEIDSRFILNLNEKTTVQKLVSGWKAGLKSMIVDLTGEELKTWLNYVREIGLIVKDEHFKDRRVHNVAFFSHGWLNISALEPLPSEMTNILERFATVYSLTYRRFLDLQKAEAQAREAQIELGLERVRARAMAMQNSNELSDLVAILFEELTKLDLILARCIIWIFDPDTYAARVWMANAEDKKTAQSYFIKRLHHSYYDAIIEGWKQRNPKWVYNLKGNEKKSIDELLFNETELSQLPQIVKTGIANSPHTIVSGSFNNFGFIETSGRVALTDEQMEIVNRFTKVFDLTYTRFNDLQQAEANAKEAVKQAALDRIRADIASMRTVSDLDRITPLIWNELTVLGIPFIRCGVFIMDDAQKLIHTFLSTPEGKAIAAFHLPYDTPGHFPEIVSHWSNKKIYISRWHEEDFKSIAETLVKQGSIATKEQYLNALPTERFYLHFLPFLQGMLYVGNTVQLDEEAIKLIQSVADAFSTAYARYEDFNKLEAAKQQVEKTLTDLKQTQQQLIQAEKMASLGELTAGVAHEIQNPLNFVNNFSEVSNELLDEMKTELETGNMQQATEIAEDVKQNLEKILHHGKRADAIVKGMLQHSRVSTGQKEPTDINALCDEYLRLSYHGLRAKDKAFNATIKTEFDDSIGKINIVPQDIGRVLLNLFNNAFYAVNEKKKNPEGFRNPRDLETYEPAVFVKTKKINDRIEIKVSDNGIGIPQKVVDKIFQPFFTTKPSGQGTGLGLSLSYDIMKAHGGEIKVETKEGEGSEFVVQLP